MLVYPDCALADALGPKLTVRQPTLFAMAALDDWTPPAQCRAVVDRVAMARDLVETRIYEGAHHSFDALGLPVRYLDGVGNRKKPGGCCGALWRQRARVEGVRGGCKGVPGEDAGA